MAAATARSKSIFAGFAIGRKFTTSADGMSMVGSVTISGCIKVHQIASRKGRKGRKERLDRTDLPQSPEHPLPVFISLRPLRTLA
jgi:hypothetical protein